MLVPRLRWSHVANILNKNRLLSKTLNMSDIKVNKNPKGDFKKNKLRKPFKRKPNKYEAKVKAYRNKKKFEIDKKKLEKYDRGPATNTKMVKVKIEQKKITKREKKISFGVQQAARSEILLTEESGYLQPDDGEVTTQYNQTEIKNSVDMLSASKRFDLDLKNFGPYRMNYTRNGRFLLLGGRKGHVAAIDWITKKLLCEINVMESVYDVAWLHQETLYAVAQKKWVYIYDNQGVEIHCLKTMNDVIKMMFLPYHFLLSTVSSSGFISWLDVSIGKMVEQFRVKNKGSASTIAQHPGNAMICVGEPNGLVSFWGPNSKKAAVTKFCHKAPICAVCFHPNAINFTTAAVDRSVKIWDARNLNGPLENYYLRSSPHCMSTSQKGMLAFGLGNVIEVYKDSIVKGLPEKNTYLRHKVPRTVSNMEFCPFEDVLGVAHSTGFTSVLVPGSGEPNFDALEINPFQTKSQRREAEVKALLGKIPSDLITWDTTELRKVDIPSLEEIIEAKKQIAHIKPPSIHFVPKKKTGKQSGTANANKRKKIMKEDFKRNYIKDVKALKGDKKSEKGKKKTVAESVLDRFITKTKN